MIATRDELRERLAIGRDNPARVPLALLDSLIAASQRYIENYTHRVFSPNPALVDGADTAPAVTKTFTIRRRGAIRLPDLRSYSSITLDGNAITENTDFLLDVYAGDQPYTSITPIFWNPYTNPFNVSLVSTLTVVGRWGWNPAPEDVKNVALEMAARMYRRRDAMYADVVDTGTGAFEYRTKMPENWSHVLDMYKIPQIALC